MTFVQFTQAMSQEVTLPNNEDPEVAIRVFEMGDEDFEEEES
jgi:hypothetical protein